MAQELGLVLVGFGVGDQFQITIQAQRMLNQHGFSFGIGIPPRLKKLLDSWNIEVEELDDRLDADLPWEDRLLDVADVVLGQTEVERPVLFLVPENPLFFNSLSRFLVAEGRAREVRVTVVPGTSQLDVLVNELGIDIAARGLQVLEASQFAAGKNPCHSSSPAVLFGLAALAESGSFDSLKKRLSHIYSPDHPVTLFTAATRDGGAVRATVLVSDFDELVGHITGLSSLYVQHVPA